MKKKVLALIVVIACVCLGFTIGTNYPKQRIVLNGEYYNYCFSEVHKGVDTLEYPGGVQFIYTNTRILTYDHFGCGKESE